MLARTRSTSTFMYSEYSMKACRTCRHKQQDTGRRDEIGERGCTAGGKQATYSISRVSRYEGGREEKQMSHLHVVLSFQLLLLRIVGFTLHFGIACQPVCCKVHPGTVYNIPGRKKDRACLVQNLPVRCTPRVACCPLAVRHSDRLLKKCSAVLLSGGGARTAHFSNPTQTVYYCSGCTKYPRRL